MVEKALVSDRHTAFHMKWQCCMAKIHWLDHVWNTEVSFLTDLGPGLDPVVRRRSSLFGHVARLPEDTPAHQDSNATGTTVHLLLTSTSGDGPLYVDNRGWCYSPCWWLCISKNCDYVHENKADWICISVNSQNSVKLLMTVAWLIYYKKN